MRESVYLCYCQHHIIETVHLGQSDRHVRQNSKVTPPRFPTSGVLVLYNLLPVTVGYDGISLLRWQR